MVSKTEFKAKLDGTFERKLRAAYMAGFQDGFDDGAFADFDDLRPEEIETLFQSWLKDPISHTGITMNEETA